MRQAIERFKNTREKYYSKFLKKKRIYYNKPKHLENYPVNSKLKNLKPYRKIRISNIDLLETVKKIRSLFS